VKNYVEQNKSIGAIITFDDYGVSGHPNHIDIYRGVKYNIYKIT
jgi:hypothetical protein